MCSTTYAPRSVPRFTHYACTMEEPFPRFIHNVTEKELQCAFPDLFEAIAVSLFLEDAGYTGLVDDKYEPSPGKWYGISWGCIHYYAYYLWQSPAWDLRWMFWKRCWMWIITFGKAAWFTSDERKLISAAFSLPFPVALFSQAVVRLVRHGILDKKIEDFGDDKKVAMYYPTQQLAQKLAAIRRM